jgi:hypothetical protein
MDKYTSGVIAGYRVAVDITKIIAAVAVCALIAGCTPDRGDYYGDWVGKKGQKYQTLDETIAGTLDRVRLQIKPNDDFMLIDGGVPMEGKVRWNGGGATLEILKLLGKASPNVPSPTISKRARQLVLSLEGAEIKLDKILKN